jgi:hypothetical protein
VGGVSDRPSFTGTRPGPPPPPSPSPPGVPGDAWRRLAELLALTAFALAQPVLDTTGRSPDFFLYRQASPGELRLLLLLVVLAPPLAIWLAEQAVGLASRAAAKGLHLFAVAALFGVVAVEVGKHLRLPTGVPLALLAAAAGAALAVLAARSGTFRSLLTYAAPAPLVFALLFVTTSPAGALVRPASGSARATAVAAHRPPVVVVFLDEFPVRALLDEHGAVDARLFPHFARLAGSSTWYPNATGVGGWTPYAVPAMLTGRYPEKVVAPSYVAHPDNLFTLLDGAYEVNAFESVAQLCPPDVCDGVPAGRETGLAPLLRDTLGVARDIVSPERAEASEGEEFGETEDEDADEEAAEEAADDEAEDVDFRFAQTKANQPERFTAFLDTLTPADRPTLSFLHLLLPHGPWVYLPSGNKVETVPLAHVLPPQPANAPSRLLANDPVLSTFATQRLLLQLAYTDGLIGQLMDRMRASRLWDDALLVVTADHGEGLAAGSHWRSLEDANAADLAWVPLFVKQPGQRTGAVDRRNEEQVDLLPTIADVLDVRVPWEVDGRSLLGPPRSGAAKSWYDVPGERREIDAARWLPTVRRGLAPAVATPARGRRGLYAVAAVRHLVGRRVDRLTVGSPSPLRARLAVSTVRRPGGVVPALLRGDLDRPAGSASTWLAVSVNGTIAGGAAAVPGPRDGRWRFMGLVDDTYLRDGANDVVLYTVEGNVMHPIAWQD